MELSNIKRESNWGVAASDLNVNFQKINSEVEKVKNQTTRNKGYFQSEEDLKKRYPEAYPGDIAYVADSGSFIIWKWDGTTWQDTGLEGKENVPLGDYYTRDDVDIRTEYMMLGTVTSDPASILD